MSCEATTRAIAADSAASSLRAGPYLPSNVALRLWKFACLSTLLLLVTSSTGCCRLLNLAYRTTRYEPGLYCGGCDETDSLALYSRWADEAWGKETGGCVDPTILPDYRLGFRAGFVDYCYAGGTGEPPPVPPRIYWNIGGRLDGKAAARAWFDGYRHGARSAHDGGYRQSAVVQSSTAVYHSRLENHRSDMAQDGEMGLPIGKPPVESLPAPVVTPHVESPGSEPPEEPSQDPMPKLTPPATEKRLDSASTRSRLRRVEPVSYESMATPHRVAGDFGAALATHGDLAAPDRSNDHRRTLAANELATGSLWKPSGSCSPTGEALESDLESRPTCVGEDAEKTDQDDRNTGSAARPQAPKDNRTSLVFKSTP